MKPRRVVCSARRVSVISTESEALPASPRLRSRAGLAAALSLLAAALLSGLIGNGLQVDASVDALVAASNPESAQQQSEAVFGAADAVMVGLLGREILTADDFAAVRAVSRALEDSPLIAGSNDITRVSVPSGDSDAVDVSSVYRRVRNAPGLASTLALELAANPVLSGQLISADARAAAIVATPAEAEVDADALRALAERTLAEGGWTQRLQVVITGPPVLKQAAAGVLVADLKKLLPIMFAVMLALLGIAFLHWAAVLWPALVLCVALAWTLAAMAAVGIPLNLVTVVTPPLVITLGLAYAMHYISAHIDLGDAASALAEQAHAFRLTTLTTVIGLLALLSNPLPAVQLFAISSAIGVVCAVGANLLLLPGLLTIARPSAGLPAPLERTLQSLGGLLGRVVVQRRRLIIGAALVVLVAMLAATSRVHTGTNVLAGLPSDSLLRDDFAQLNTQFAGANRFGVLIDGYTPDAMLQRAHIDAINQLQSQLAALPGIGTASSYLDTARMVNRSLRGNTAELPSATALKQLIVFAAPGEIYAQVDPQFQRALLVLTTTLTDTADLTLLLDEIDALTAALPGSVQASTVGGSVELAQTISRLAQGQGVSLAIALLAIFVVLCVVFASVRVGALTLLPNVLPVAIYFGLLGIAGIPLGPTTSLVACIVLGIAVDDTLHYLLRFNRMARDAADEQHAAQAAIKAVIRPITLTTLALCLGFLTLSGSALAEQALFGMLAALTLALAWFSDLLLTPALSARAGMITLWDVLRLDLGRDPQDSIPLLNQLSSRQARIFALLSDLHTVPAGTRVLNQGDAGDDVYVVVDGTLKVSTVEDGIRTDIATLTRGATIGEVGLFGLNRTADVDAKTATRLLRFTPKDLDVIQRRYPRIAARVYRNLNRIQAERRAT